MSVNFNVDFPPKLSGLFLPMRYKVAYGGRGGAKSWGYGRALLLRAAKEKTRVLCAREVQKSIKQSVLTLLSDQIQELNLGGFFEVQETQIKGRNGSHFSFAGLATHTVESVKSFEGCDIVWVEEAQTVSKKSWDILIPTIRKPGSEIWVSFNPDLDTDDTYIRFVENTPPDTLLVKINYSDNPWFPDVLEKERQHCKNTTPLDYENIWEGKCKAAVDGAIYADEISKAQEEKRVCNVPYDPMLKVHVVFDLGWNDSMFISLVQRGANELRIIESIEDSHKTLKYYSDHLKSKKLNYGKVFLPHDGATKDFKTGKSSEEILRELGWTVEIVDRASVEEGIKLSRSLFDKCFFDKDRAHQLVLALKRYKRQIPTTTGEPGAPLHDSASHGADNFRYICQASDRMTDDGEIIKKHWWRRWPDDVPLPICHHVFHSYYAALSDDDLKKSVYSACTRWGVFWHPTRERYCLMLLGRWYEKSGYTEFRKNVIGFDKKFNPDVSLIEKKYTGKSIIRDLKDSVAGAVREYDPGQGEDSISRANSVSTIFEMALVYVPPTKWAGEIIDIISEFPSGNSKSSSITNTVTQALIYIRRAGWFENRSDEDLRNKREQQVDNDGTDE